MPSKIAHWPFDDGSGSTVVETVASLNGSVQSLGDGATWSGDAPAGIGRSGSLEFAAPGASYGLVTVAGGYTDLLKNRTAQTVCGWIKVTVADRIQIFLTANTNEGTSGYGSETDRGMLQHGIFYIDQGDGNLNYLHAAHNAEVPFASVVRFYDQTITADDTWHHWALVRTDADTCVAYWDGVELDSWTDTAANPFTLPNPDYSANLYFGDNVTLNPTFSFFGRYCDWRIYDFALDASQIGEVMAGGEPTPPIDGAAELTTEPAECDGTGEFTAPGYVADADLSTTAATCAATGTFSAPVYTGSVSANNSAATCSAAGSFAPPVYTGSGNGSTNSATCAASGTFSPPVFSGSVDLTTNPATCAAEGTFAQFIITAAVDASTQAASCSAAGAIISGGPYTVDAAAIFVPGAKAAGIFVPGAQAARIVE